MSENQEENKKASVKPEITERDHNLSVSVWKNSKGTPVKMCRSVKIPERFQKATGKKYEDMVIWCFCSDAKSFYKLLGDAIAKMEKDGSYPMEYKPKK